MEMFFEIRDVVRTYMYNQETIIVEWDNLFNNDVIKRSCLAQLNKVKEGAKYLIIETSKAQGVPSQATQNWFASDLFPELEKAGLKAMITVVPESTLTKMASRSWIKRASDFRFDSYDANSLDDAKKLVESI
jgi:hypothetical protein